ncbi:hypothetical protein D3C85_1618920 [compost metagenome]
MGYVARCVHIDNEDVEIILEESQILAVDRRKSLLWPRRYGCRCLFQEIQCMSRGCLGNEIAGTQQYIVNTLEQHALALDSPSLPVGPTVLRLLDTLTLFHL